MVILTSRRNNGYLSLLPMEPLVLRPDLSQQSRRFTTMEFLKELSSIHPYLPHVFTASIVIALYILCGVITSFGSSVVRAIEAWQAPKMPPKPPQPPAPPPLPKTRSDVLIALIAERAALTEQIGTRLTTTWEDEQLQTLNTQISALLDKEEWEVTPRPSRACLGRAFLFYESMSITLQLRNLHQDRILESRYMIH